MYKQQTLIVSLNFTNIINFFLKSPWLITMLFQGQQRCWCRTWWNQVLRLVLAYIEGVVRLIADRCGDWWVRIGGTQRVCFYMKFVCAGEMSWWTGVYIYILFVLSFCLFLHRHTCTYTYCRNNWDMKDISVVIFLSYGNRIIFGTYIPMLLKSSTSKIPVTTFSAQLNWRGEPDWPSDKSLSYPVWVTGVSHTFYPSLSFPRIRE